MIVKNSFVLIYGGFERVGCLNNKKKEFCMLERLK